MHTLYSLALRFCCPFSQLRRSSPPPQPLIPPSVPASGASTPWCICGMEKEREDEETEGRERPEPLTDVERGIIQDTWARVYESCEDVGITILIRCSKFTKKSTNRSLVFFFFLPNCYIFIYYYFFHLSGKIFVVFDVFLEL